MNDAVIDKPLDWEDPIENDGNDFVVLKPGEYPFEVLGFERARSKGNDKNPACNMAKVNIAICDDSGNHLAKIVHNIYLSTKSEWVICQFFRSIGLRKHGEKFVMNWNAIGGKCGRCTVINKEESSKNDPAKKIIFNNIGKFLDPAEEVATANSKAAATFTPGDF